MKRLILLLSLLGLWISCSPSKKVQSRQEKPPFFIKTKNNKITTFHYRLWRVLETYTQTYNKCPRNADDLMQHIEKLGDNFFITHDYAYQFLKKNKDKLIFVISEDSVTTIYKGKIKDNRIVEKANFVHPCDHMQSAQVDFYDDRGYKFRSDSLSETVSKRLLIEYHKYLREVNKDRGSVFYRRTILEYTHEGLKDQCSNTSLDPEESVFYRNILDYLDSLATAYQLSRITAPSYIDK